MSEAEIASLVAAWVEGDSEGTMYDACTENPQLAWRAILDIAQRSLTEDEEALLAAGPLEDLLSWHGPEFIDRVEREAKINSQFNHLLGGVWRNEMPEEIWQRIQKMRNEVW